MRLSPALPEDPIAQAIAGLLQGQHVAWPVVPGRSSDNYLVDYITHHGVGPLLHAKFTRESAPADVPRAVAEACHRAAIALAVWELEHAVALKSLLAAFGNAGIETLVLKGTALAITHYRYPAVRPRGDTDLLVAPYRRDAALRILEQQDFEPLRGLRGEDAVAELAFSRVGGTGLTHTIDLHWRINNAPVIAVRLPFADLWRRGRPLPTLGDHVRALGDVDALLYACIHRAVHMQHHTMLDDVEITSGDSLFWLYDLYLLLRGFSDRDFIEAKRGADDLGLQQTVAQGIYTTLGLFSIACPSDFRGWVDESFANADWLTRYFAASPTVRVWKNLAALGGPARMTRFAVQHAFPARDHMLQKYARARIQWLPWLYARRIIAGLSKARTSRAHVTSGR